MLQSKHGQSATVYYHHSPTDQRGRYHFLTMKDYAPNYIDRNRWLQLHSYDSYQDYLNTNHWKTVSKDVRPVHGSLVLFPQILPVAEGLYGTGETMLSAQIAEGRWSFEEPRQPTVIEDEISRHLRQSVA